jgi:hypothetical protein
MGANTKESDRGMARPHFFSSTAASREKEAEQGALANHGARLDDILPHLGGTTVPTTLTRGAK